MQSREEKVRERAETLDEKAGVVLKRLPLEIEEAKLYDPPRNPNKRMVIFLTVFLVLAISLGSFAWWFGGAVRKLESIRFLAEENARNLNPLASEGGSAGNVSVKSFLGKVQLLKFAKEIPTLYRTVAGLSVSMDRISREIQAFEDGFPNVLFGKGSVAFTDILASVRDSLRDIEKLSAEILSRDSALREYLPQSEGYLSWSGHLSRSIQLLESTITTFASAEPRHIFIIFQNNSEMRPTGGFWGSFADAKIKGGKIEKLIVYDINELNRTDVRNIIPPKPLQVIASRWRAADANWFFSYADSAAKFSEFAKASGLFDGASTTVDAVIAVSPGLVSDILKITGPIEISTGTVITNENFLVSIQEEVQEGQAKKEKEPKRVLKELLPMLVERIGEVSDKEKIFELIPSWLQERDIMIWASDPSVEKIFAYYGADGGVFQPPRLFSGDYLAVVPANIGGAKTDLYITQDVKLDSNIDESGLITNRLEIKRTHGGNKAVQWWYREPNQAYMRVFVPRDARLLDATGGVAKKIVPKVSYKNGFIADPDVSLIEASREIFEDFPLVERFIESGKSVFALWTRVERGKSTKITFEYSRRLSGAPISGGTYDFTLEAPPGIFGSYHISITAPPGFVWSETDSPTYGYTGDAGGRITKTLTFSAI